jgi:glycine/D-amino acid oxidase-like deaminating enzyme
MRNGEVSWWWRALGGFPARRASLPGPQEADVCIVGAGYTGLWAAYYLKSAQPDLRVVVLEAAFAGFGASGRNGGWVTAENIGSREKYARGPSGATGVRALEAALRATVAEIERACGAEQIGCDFVAGGRLQVATTPAQLARMRASLEAARAWGDGEDVLAFLSADELAGRVNVAGALGGLFAPHSARVQPASLVAGLAAAAERRGVVIYEATPVTEILPSGAAGGAGAVARTVFGDVRARVVLRCTEGFTARLPGARRALLPMNSSMVVTEPLDDAAWKEIGWAGCETMSDEAHA